MRRGIACLVAVLTTLPVGAHSQATIRMSAPGPAIAWSCELQSKAGEAYSFSGLFDPVPADPVNERITGNKQLINHIHSASHDFFETQENAHLNDIIGLFSTAGRTIVGEHGTHWYHLDLRLGDDGVGAGRLWVLSTPPENATWLERLRFVGKRNMAIGFCNHTKARLRVL